ncbi:MAG: hypothetical protein VW518_10000 [Burkholderiaceae bacterium]|jgi:hypothetical protein
MEIEIDFCFGERIEVTKGVFVPPVGATIQIAKQDYTVKQVYWALDYADDTHINTKLRAIVDCVLRESE